MTPAEPSLVNQKGHWGHLQEYKGGVTYRSMDNSKAVASAWVTAQEVSIPGALCRLERLLSIAALAVYTTWRGAV